MRRLIHSIGRWRRTHCETCGRRITDYQTAVAAEHGRLMHLHPSDCRGTTGWEWTG